MMPGTMLLCTNEAAVRRSIHCRENDNASGRCCNGLPLPMKRVARAWKSAPKKKKEIARRACSQALGWLAGCDEAPSARMIVFPAHSSFSIGIQRAERGRRTDQSAS